MRQLKGLGYFFLFWFEENKISKITQYKSVERKNTASANIEVWNLSLWLGDLS